MPSGQLTGSPCFSNLSISRYSIILGGSRESGSTELVLLAVLDKVAVREEKGRSQQPHKAVPGGLGRVQRLHVQGPVEVWEEAEQLWTLMGSPG
jgi:hypothetical protein